VGDLLAAFERAALPNSEVVLIGGRSAESDRLLKPYRQVPNTIITGQLPQPKMREWFARSSVFVLPSIEDGFGLVIMEAQACGLPVIATVNTGGPDVIDDGRNGFVVPIRSPDAIAEKLAFLYANPDQLRAMREESLLTAKNSRGWDAFAQGMLELYGELRNGS
jgi:glycosyltransferase involved in cell wall biosynthesis